MSLQVLQAGHHRLYHNHHALRTVSSSPSFVSYDDLTPSASKPDLATALAGKMR